MQLKVLEVQVAPPGLAVTVYEAIGEPPLAGSAHETCTHPSPGTTSGAEGAEGGDAGRKGSEGADTAPGP